MVSDTLHLPSTETISDYTADTDSLKQCEAVSLSSTEDDFACNAVALQSANNQNGEPTFGNIAVSNSSGIHFGNNTYYQGPVTIKKIVYAGQDGQTNDVLSAASIENGKCAGIDNPVCSFDNGAINDVKFSGTEKTLNVAEKPFASKLRSKPFIISIVTISIAICSLIVLLALLLQNNNNLDNHSNGQDEGDNENSIDPIDLPENRIKVITRQEWLARPPTALPNELLTPVKNVIIWHTATENCTTQVTCTFLVKQIQNFHMQSRKWWDIAYNFLVGGDGYVYEGRGWIQEGSHTKAYNNISIGIALIGTFTNYSPSKRQTDAAQNLIKLGISEMFIQEDYQLFGARQLSSTESPGRLAFDILKHWPHWVNTTTLI